MTDESNDNTNDENLGSLTDIESKASEKGWVPQTEWEGDPDQWRPAREFVDRGELMDRISSQTRQLNRYTSEVESLREGMKSLAEHNKKIAEQEYEKALTSLKGRKASALELDDFHSAVDIDDQILELKESKKEIEKAEIATSKEEETQQSSPQIHPDVSAWMDKNEWYAEDIILQGAADAVAKQYLSTNPSAETDPGKVLDYVASQIKKEFPDRFGEPKRRPSGTNDSWSAGKKSPASKKAKYTIAHLNEEQRRIAKTFVSSGVMKEQEYVDQLASLGELG